MVICCSSYIISPIKSISKCQVISNLMNKAQSKPKMITSQACRISDLLRHTVNNFLTHTVCNISITMPP